MFGMKGFHVSASGAIQGHHGPLVYTCRLPGDFHLPFTILRALILDIFAVYRYFSRVLVRQFLLQVLGTRPL